MTVAPSLRETTSPRRSSDLSCWDRWAGSIPTSGSISATAWSRSLSSSSTLIRAGCPSVLKNSALSWYSGVLTAGGPSQGSPQRPGRRRSGGRVDGFTETAIANASNRPCPDPRHRGAPPGDPPAGAPRGGGGRSRRFLRGTLLQDSSLRSTVLRSALLRRTVPRGAVLLGAGGRHELRGRQEQGRDGDVERAAEGEQLVRVEPVRRGGGLGALDQAGGPAPAGDGGEGVGERLPRQVPDAAPLADVRRDDLVHRHRTAPGAGRASRRQGQDRRPGRRCGRVCPTGGAPPPALAGELPDDGRGHREREQDRQPPRIGGRVGGEADRAVDAGQLADDRVPAERGPWQRDPDVGGAVLAGGQSADLGRVDDPGGLGAAPGGQGVGRVGDRRLPRVADGERDGPLGRPAEPRRG